MQTITTEQLTSFHNYLVSEEKSTATVEKYLRDARAFFLFLAGRALTKELVVAYKEHLQAKKYAIRSINSMLAAVNHFLQYINRPDCRVRALKVQRAVYLAEERALTRAEYDRLLNAAGSEPKLHLILQTICATGIRVSELQYFTLEAAKRGEVVVHCKGKSRTILIPRELSRHLLDYAKTEKIRSGVLFRNRRGEPMDRRTIWAKMKALCQAAKVQATKVFPHNLRKLFARAFYAVEKDIAKLADVLGHSSIDTTRIYIMTTGKEHRKQIERLGLV